MTAIDRIKPFAEGKDDVHVVIDTPRGSRNKLKWDRKHGVLRLSHVLTAGAMFPFDFGFVPGTHGADGDALDVLGFLMSHCSRYVWFKPGSLG